MPETHDEASTNDEATRAVASEEDVRQAQRDRATTWVREKWRAPTNCPICGNTIWTVTDVAQVMPFRAGGIFIGGPVTPVFMLICTNCGYTMVFNAAIASVVTAQPSGGAVS
jgi:predicted nucleic-acid-binding Zn-ribbon protein